MFAALNAFQTGGPTLPVNIVAPAVTGTATVRQTLSVSTGTWVGAPTITYAYQWQRNTGNISGATSSTYTLVDADATAVIRCVVTATNLFGSASANSNNTGAVATAVPTAPTIGTATAGNTQATVTFTAPTSTGGTAITSYTAVSSPGGFTATGASSPLTVTGLSNGTAYTFTVYATNAVGNSASSAASNSVTPATVPGAPTIGTATATGTTTATVSYTAPASNGGSTITSYTAVSSPGGITGTLATSGSGTITVSGLSAGTPYTFTVYATNAVGNSASSASSNQIVTQAPTLNWVQRTSLPWISSPTAITFGNGVFVAVNGDGNAYYSSNGINWTLGNEVTSSTNSLLDVAYGNGAFAAVTWFTSEIDYSTDNGANWYGASDPVSGYSAGSIVYGNGQWLCSLSNSITLYSLTGPSSWSIAPSSISTVAAYDMIYVDGYFYAGGVSLIERSTGYNQPWSQVSNRQAQKLTYGNGIFLGAAVSDGGISRSTNGTSWTFTSYTTDGPQASYGLTYGNGVFLAADSANDKVWISTNGTNWFTSLTPLTVSSLPCLAYGNGVFVFTDTYYDPGTGSAVPLLYTAAY